jgi:hypothetical protein
VKEEHAIGDLASRLTVGEADDHAETIAASHHAEQHEQGAALVGR